MLEPEESTHRRGGVIRAYDNAVDLASEIEASDKKGHLSNLAPWSTYMMCFAGALFISKVVHSAYRPFIDTDAGKRAFNICHHILRQCSVEDNDLPGRSSRLVAQIWDIHRSRTTDLEKPPLLKVASRMFFSVVYDSLWLWREKYAGLPSNGAPPLPPPFIPNSLSLSPASAPAVQSPSMSTASGHSNAAQAITSTNHKSQAVVSYDDLNGLTHEGPPGSVSEGLNVTTNTGFDSLWDIGFLNPNELNFDLPFSGYDVAYNEPGW
jgi:hypothetical protein